MIEARPSSFIEKPQHRFLIPTAFNGPSLVIQRLFISCTVHLFRGTLFSSKEFYKGAQVLLITASVVGSMAAVAHFLSGSHAKSYLLFFLSSTSGIGSYLAYRCSEQYTLEQHSKKLIQEVLRLKELNVNLVQQIQDLGKNNLILEAQNENFKNLCERFDQQLKQFNEYQTVNGQSLGDLVEGFKSNIQDCQLLWLKISEENKTGSQELSREVEKIKKSIAGITDLKAALYKLEELNSINLMIQSRLEALEKMELHLKEVNMEILKGVVKLEQYEQFLEKIKELADDVIRDISSENASFHENNKELCALIKKLKSS